MAMLKKLAFVATAAGLARSYARKNPEKVNRLAEQAGRLVDQRTKGKYHAQIDRAVRKTHEATRPKY